MKYVIFLKDDEMERGKKSYHPLFFPTHVTHADLHLISRQPGNFSRGEMVSAGFFFIQQGGVIKVDRSRISESTGLGPGPHDDKILQLAFDGSWRGNFLEEKFQ